MTWRKEAHGKEMKVLGFLCCVCYVGFITDCIGCSMCSGSMKLETDFFFSRFQFNNLDA